MHDCDISLADVTSCDIINSYSKAKTKMPGINASQVDVSDEALQSTTISDILANVTTALSIQTNGTGAEPDPVKAKIKEVFNIAVLIVLCVLMMSIGAVIKLDMIKAHFRRPVGIIIGMVCQFIVLPVVAFGLAHALQLERWSAIGMILIGTTPGGSTSNMFTFYVDGDVPLR